MRGTGLIKTLTLTDSSKFVDTLVKSELWVWWARKVLGYWISMAQMKAEVLKTQSRNLPTDFPRCTFLRMVFA